MSKEFSMAFLEVLRASGCLFDSQSGFVPPSSEQLKTLIDLSGWSLKEVARITGSNYNELKKDSPTVRGWLKGNRCVPYSAWRLMLLKYGAIKLADL